MKKNMKQYVKPTCECVMVEAEGIMAASPALDIKGGDTNEALAPAQRSGIDWSEYIDRK